MSTVVVTDQTLRTLLLNPSDRQHLPCANLVPLPGKPCNCAKGKTRQFTPAEIESVKICITRLAPDRLQLLKQHWKVDRLVVYLNTPGLPSRVVL